jgi:hypothetical protein
VLRDERALLVRDLESMEGVLADQPRPAAATGPSVRERLEERERADRDFRRLDQEARERMAAERLEELKRKLR